MRRSLLVLFLSLVSGAVQADAWGDCRDSLKAGGAVFSTDSYVSGITLIQTLAGLSFEPTPGEEPIVTIAFENGERAVLDESNTVFLSRFMIVKDLMNADDEDIGSYFVKDKRGLSIIRAKDGCTRLGVVTTWPQSFATD